MASAGMDSPTQGSDPKAPYLIVAAFWSDTDIVDEVADAVGADVFPRPEGLRGAVVSFRYEVADDFGFQRLMERLDLREVNDRRPGLKVAG